MKVIILFKTSYLIKIVFLFAVYFITARFGLTLNAVSGFATLIWLPTGISLAALLIWGFKLWPAIVLGAFLVNLLAGAPFLVAAGIAIGNTLEALLGAYLIKKVTRQVLLDRLKDVLLLIVASVFSTAISATIGVSSLWLGQVISGSNYSATWTAWWIGDMVSNLIIAPFILIWSTRLHFKLSSKRFGEVIIMSLFVLVISAVIFLSADSRNSSKAYMVFPPLIWVSLRFGQVGAITTIFFLSLISILATFGGLGPFVMGSLDKSLPALQIFVGVTGITAMVLGAVASEKQRLEERKNEFISIASHELKTPIATLKGYTQILEQHLQKNKDPGVRLYISKLSYQLDKLTKLVNDLLDVSKIQVGKLELHKENLEISKLVKEVVEDMQLNSKHKIVFKQQGERQIMADRDRISEVVTNLISNAIKYSPKSNKVLVQTIGNGNGVLISVQDFGIGISEKDKERIFERFFQADTRIRKSFSGLGLGLYISSEIIRRHGGDIWVDSVKGKGTTITFKLPKSETS